MPANKKYKNESNSDFDNRMGKTGTARETANKKARGEDQVVVRNGYMKRKNGY